MFRSYKTKQPNLNKNATTQRKIIMTIYTKTNSGNSSSGNNKKIIMVKMQMKMTVVVMLMTIY